MILDELDAFLSIQAQDFIEEQAIRKSIVIRK